MDVGSGVTGNGLTTGIVAAAGVLASALPQQDAVLRGSLATQSLAADLAVDVHEVVKNMDGAVGTGVVQSTGVGGGNLGGIGNKALEVMIVQTLAATIPAMVNKAINACGTRRAPRPQTSNSPEISPIPVHHRMDSENSESFQGEDMTLDEDAVNYPSEDFNNFSMDTDQARERGDRILGHLQKENQSRRIQATKLKKQVSQMEKDHKTTLEKLRQEIKDINIKQSAENHESTKEPTKEPEMPEPSRPTEDKKKWVAKHVDFDQLTCKNKNIIIDNIKAYMKKKNNVDPQQIWVQLTKGSLIVEAEADDDPGNLIWPGDHEMINMVDNVIRGTATPAPPPGMPTMAERVKDVMDPWQMDENDPWRHVESEDLESLHKQ